ncbi:MAG TPA: F0F1 ATP synthase subunit alpha, partial [Burkholderiaceae bacterium]|nr:F0F1 ATP synthase subunit alpha [Burkholderiaceae bacterium]
AVLLALTEGLFDPVPLDQMEAAERAVREAAAALAQERVVRLVDGDKLSDEDREAILTLARQALAPLLPHSDTDAANAVAQDTP